MPKATDKRVFDITCAAGESGPQRVLAIGADSTVLDLYLALLGAFRWRGDYDRAEREYRITIGSRTFELGKGSRTPLRRVLDVGTRLNLTVPDLAIDAEVTNSYLVQSRRHFPKVMGAADPFDVRRETWDAQAAMRREFRGWGPRTPMLSPAEPRERTEPWMHGFFSAIVSGPIAMPSEWLPHVTNMSAFAEIEDVRASVSGIMNQYNAVARQVYEKRDEFISEVEGFANIAQGEGSIEWARGYFDGIALRVDEWDGMAREEAFRKLMMPLALLHLECGRDPKKREWLRDAEFRNSVAHSGALAAIGIWEEWRQRLIPPHRSDPKISRNAPCPCGSGKKYKRCCGSLLRIVSP